MEKIAYLVKDEKLGDIKIVGNYFPSQGDKAIILLHMMPATKESWDTLAGRFNERGFHVLAIDLRGHGESTQATQNGAGVTLDYKTFSSEQHRTSWGDVEGARAWLIGKGIKPENISAGGASIGANLAVWYLAAHPEATRAFLLSPGLDYHGLKADEAMLKLSETQHVFLVAANDDAYSAESVKTLSETGASNKKVQVYDEGGHGTALFDQYPELMDSILNWAEGIEEEEISPAGAS